MNTSREQSENWPSEMDLIDDHLRKGERQFAQEKLKILLPKIKKGTRKSYARFAELLRRSGLASKSLGLLFPYVRGQGRKKSSATLYEKEEYAAALIALKATNEGEDLLLSLTEEGSEKAYLFLGLSCMSKWDYAQALKYLDVFLTFKNTSSYDHFIGLTNQLACLVTLISNTETKKINLLETKIEKAISFARKNHFDLLLSNLLEIQSQFFLKTSQVDDSKLSLEKASTLLKDNDSKENLFIEKWKLLSQMPTIHQKSWSSWKEKILLLQKKALKLGHAETVRDIDFYLGFENENLLHKVYFGTPFEVFRERIKEKIGPPAFFLFNISKDPATFTFDYKKWSLRAGSKTMNLLKGLCDDFYRPINRYGLFAFVYPGEFFNPETSFNKLNVALTRTRQWLQKNKIPLIIIEKSGIFYLEGSVEIKIYKDDREKQMQERKVDFLFESAKKLKIFFGLIRFKATQAHNVFNNDQLKTTQRLLKKLCEEKMLFKEGLGKNTFYHF